MLFSMAEGGRLTSLLWALLPGLEAALARGSLILSLASASEMRAELQMRRSAESVQSAVHCESGCTGGTGGSFAQKQQQVYLGRGL